MLKALLQFSRPLTKAQLKTFNRSCTLSKFLEGIFDVKIDLFYRKFRISVTFEMRTSEYIEICISIDIKTVAEQAFKQNGKMGKESKVAERQRERESVCVCVRVLIKTDDSVDQHPQTAWDRETHLATNDSQHL